MCNQNDSSTLSSLRYIGLEGYMTKRYNLLIVLTYSQCYDVDFVCATRQVLNFMYHLDYCDYSILSCTSVF